MKPELFGEWASKSINRKGTIVNVSVYKPYNLWVNIDRKWSMTTFLPDQNRFNGFTKDQRPKIWRVLNPDEVTQESEIVYQ